MSFTLIAPLPLTQTTSVLPNPNFGNSEALTSTINILRTITGRRRTYVQTTGRRKLTWDFTLTRNKALEMLEFYRSYNAQRIFVRDHEDRGWQGWITNNPFEIEMTRRGLPRLQGWPAGESCNVTIEFQGFQSSGIGIDRDLSATIPLGAASALDINQGTFIELDIPAPTSLVHNWDATRLTGLSDLDYVHVWPDNGLGNNDLIATVGAPFNPTIVRPPRYVASSPIFNFRPAVACPVISNQFGSAIASMRTTADTQLFPNRRGSIFWVVSNGISLDRTEEQLSDLAGSQTASSVESGVWSLQSNGLGTNVEQVHFAGSSNQFTPVSARFEPADPANDPRLAQVNNGAVTNYLPIIYGLIRDGDTLKFRTNGVVRSGTTIQNNSGYTGKFYINEQRYIPEYNSLIKGEWAQVMVYNQPLNDTQANEVDRYLSLKWGIPLGDVGF